MGIQQRLLRLTRSWFQDFWNQATKEEPLSEEEERLFQEAWERDFSGSPSSAKGPGGTGTGGRQNMDSYYQRLGLSPKADLPSVKRAWKNLLRQHHPDRAGSDPEAIAQATHLCQEITEAYFEIRKHVQPSTE